MSMLGCLMYKMMKNNNELGNLYNFGKDIYDLDKGEEYANIHSNNNASDFMENFNQQSQSYSPFESSSPQYDSPSPLYESSSCSKCNANESYRKRIEGMENISGGDISGGDISGGDISGGDVYEVDAGDTGIIDQPDVDADVDVDGDIDGNLDGDVDEDMDDNDDAGSSDKLNSFYISPFNVILLIIIIIGLVVFVKYNNVKYSK